MLDIDLRLAIRALLARKARDVAIARVQNTSIGYGVELRAGVHEPVVSVMVLDPA
jgi:hypothetical protein